jgi:hypothetical protein
VNVGAILVLVFSTTMILRVSLTLLRGEAERSFSIQTSGIQSFYTRNFGTYVLPEVRTSSSRAGCC